MAATKKNYLLAYNFTAFTFWSLVLISFLMSGLKMSPTVLLLLNIAQGMAVLEVLHVGLKWVKSPFMSTLAQVASRILVLVLINIFWQNSSYQVLLTPGIIIVAFAWSITEMVRYSFYFFALLNKFPGFLLWMRYSLFVVLYPMGVTGEALIMFSPVYSEGIVLNAYNLFLALVCLAYAYYFPELYGYMWKQRRAKL